MEKDRTADERRIDWSSLVKREDWISVWIGFGILVISVSGVVTYLPKVGAWSTSITDSLRIGDLPYFALLGLGLLATTSVAIRSIGIELAGYWKGFPFIFLLALVSFIVARQQAVNYFGLEYVLWALLLGLVISNLTHVPSWLKSAVKTELFIKIGLVLLGAEILFPVIVKGGAVSMLQAVITTVLTWYFCYFLAVKVGLKKSFAGIMATGVSICGVSAAIAAGIAIKGDKKEISYTISMVLLTAIVMLVAEPFIARMLDLPSPVAGAWMGGTIDTTGAVVAAGALYSNVAMTAASVVKLSQNVLIGVAAFILALYWALRVEAKTDEKPKMIDIWYRFPKFILGFVIASLVFSFILIPIQGEAAISSILGVTKGLRDWFFSLSFVCIGLETRFLDLLEVGGRKAALVYITAQTLNVVLVYCLAWLFFGGIFFPSPI